MLGRAPHQALIRGLSVLFIAPLRGYIEHNSSTFVLPYPEGGFLNQKDVVSGIGESS